MIRKVFLYTVALIFSAMFMYCNGPFPTSSKFGLPDDHTENINSVLHKEGYSFPFKESSGCSGTTCHQLDLDGGVAEVDSVETIAPSCFQCHETLWSDDVDEEGEKM